MMLIAHKFDHVPMPCTVAILWTGTKWRCVRQLHDTLEVDQVTEGSLTTAWIAFYAFLEYARSLAPHPRQVETP